MALDLLTVAEMIQDKFYQEFTPRNAFFTLNDFAEDAANVYSKMLDDMYKADKRRAKVEEGFSTAEITVDWLVEDTIKVEKDGTSVFAVTSGRIFAFTFDAMADGLQRLEPVTGRCDKFVKISHNDAWATNRAPYTPVVYYYKKNSNRIEFCNAHCVPEKVTAYYIPEVFSNDDKCIMSEAIVPAVIVSVLNLYYGIKAGMVIPKANDGNQNITLENQANQDLKK